MLYQLSYSRMSAANGRHWITKYSVGREAIKPGSLRPQNPPNPTPKPGDSAPVAPATPPPGRLD